MYNVTIFGIKLNLNPVAFTIPIGDGWTVYWYGIIIAVGFMLAVLYGLSTAKKIGINDDKLLNGTIITTPICILCARTYYLLFDGEKLSGIKEFFGFDGSGFSGLAIYGAVIGAAICAVIFSKIYKFNMLNLFDLVATSFLIGQSIGRWGNFVNQEAFGSATGSNWWGMTSQAVEYELGEGVLAHPCFLYESIWCAAGFFLLNWMLRKKRQYYGQVTLLYGVWYGFGRTIIESLRTDSLMIGNIRVSMLLSAIVCVGCSAALIIINRRKKAVAVNQTYVLMFSDITDEERNVQEENNDGEDN